MLENLEILSLVIMRVRNQLAIVGFLCIFLSYHFKAAGSNIKRMRELYVMRRNMIPYLIPITT